MAFSQQFSDKSLSQFVRGVGSSLAPGTNWKKEERPSLSSFILLPQNKNKNW